MSKTDFASKDLKDRVDNAEDRITALESKMGGYHLNETYNAANLNIDTINNEVGYIYRIVVYNNPLGTQPIAILGGNAYILIGFSAINSQQKPYYGVQIAFGFGGDKIAIRHAQYNSSGSTWGAWTAV